MAENENPQNDEQQVQDQEDVAQSHWERLDRFHELPRAEAEDIFLNLTSHEQAELFIEIDPKQRRSWIRLLAPDDTADLIQELDPDTDLRAEALALLDHQTRLEVLALLAYAEDKAGGLMNSRFARLRPDISVEEAIRYLRVQVREQVETIYYAYVLGRDQKLLGVVSINELFVARPDRLVSDIMSSEDLVTVPEQMDQEKISRLFGDTGLIAIPVVDAEHRVKGIVTVDDIVDVLQEEATEDIQKLGGMEALDAPYLKISFGQMIKKRAGWLLMLFFGEMLTATAMGHYEDQIAKAVVLALFVPLIISSGGNSGSQATTLIIRSMALGEVRMRDWLRVAGRELASGLTLGLILGSVGFMRIMLWQSIDPSVYGEHYVRLSIVVSLSLVGVVLWGTIIGSMLPFLLRKLRLDPATSSAPFVATLVDVTGLVIYFTIASFFLKGTLL
ncbi:MAG TPA: magnesium transporter [Bdellovibrionota bacterium]|nr:magnesium transporter [Bdellovibrionota bacterium]